MEIKTRVKEIEDLRVRSRNINLEYWDSRTNSRDDVYDGRELLKIIGELLDLVEEGLLSKRIETNNRIANETVPSLSSIKVSEDALHDDTAI